MPSNNPILNNPFEEPRFHYATNLKGELDYERVVSGRRPFSPEVLKKPKRISSQRKSGLEKDGAPQKFKPMKSSPNSENLKFKVLG